MVVRLRLITTAFPKLLHYSQIPLKANLTAGQVEGWILVLDLTPHILSNLSQETMIKLEGQSHSKLERKMVGPFPLEIPAQRFLVPKVPPVRMAALQISLVFYTE